MPLETAVGDLFAQRDVDALAHGVNTEGLMGAGIAAEFRRRFPDMYADYAAACRSGALQVGGLHPFQLPNRHWIYNLASQQRRGRDARLDAIESSLTDALRHAESVGVRSVALPQIGAGIGGLRWADVLAVVTRVANGSDVVVRAVSRS